MKLLKKNILRRHSELVSEAHHENLKQVQVDEDLIF